MDPRDDVTIRIDGREFTYWDSIRIETAIDAYSTVSLSAPFEPERREFRDAFRPFSFQPLEMLIGSEQVFNGTLVDVFPTLDGEKRRVEVTAYALPGVLADCNAPGDAVPLEFKGLGLQAIAAALAEPFNLDVEFAAEQGPAFEKVKLETTGKIQEFLVELAKQRGLVINNTSAGALRCWQSKPPGSPVARFIEGEPPLVTVTPEFSPQSFFSHITAFVPPRKGRRGRAQRDGSRYTVSNPWLPTVLRPHSFDVDDTEPADAPAAAQVKLGRMFGEMAAFMVGEIPAWRDSKGRRWSENTTVMLHAPGAMCYRETELLVRSVVLERDDEKKTAELTLVLPGAFSGEPPKRLPWEE